ncbi:hypothetical protein ABFS82_14G284200 [Erythranthe guttata]|uniref:Uncharacterized protein n=1 Tax=Erythranthe guttata TaxID=4155 RepID=A0A022RA48_ERYGU|nr:PREDICTED: uncharacterized protein LOC105958930 [Erythranthe guttata]EYU36608.1 hypothetical protein MIMGU_mgv1a014429mg [Erythranthe guttata]|eukprot:XP_012838385.1 PREDICTED: uncharacterized protein LOC105958930 [Erythranthe guttata]
MGACFSSESDYSRHQKPTANVVTLNGELRRYPLPATVSQVLSYEDSSPDSVFLCNSDRLFFDDYIPNLAPENELEPDQIYFVLPSSKLQRRLAASDMAALAVKASVALDATNSRRNRKSRISPVLVAEEDPIHESRPAGNKNSGKASVGSEFGVSRSRKLQRHTSRRAKFAVRSFRIGLTTINEGSVLVN